MALREQPYIPLYVQDVLTDEKLIECSAEAHGVYFRLLCILHKQEKYGLLCLKQKYKQNKDKSTTNFANMLQKQMPFPIQVIEDALDELIQERVITLNEDSLYQKRMVRDGEISINRSKTGKLGGSKSSATKQYGKKGYLYFMSDSFKKHKIGISVNPLNRLYRIRSMLKLAKNFDVKMKIPVNDMGKAEDIAIKFFADKLDGEWLSGDYVYLLKQFSLLQAKVQANTENESEYEYKNKSEYNIERDSFI